MPITIVGLGPAGLDRVSGGIRALLLDEGHRIILRTERHPGATELAALRQVETMDHLYADAPDFDDLYESIAAFVIEAAGEGPVVYAVPGSAVVGERAVSMIRAGAEDSGLEFVIEPGESFLDLVYARVGIDPIADGVQIVDARDLPDPLPLHLTTIVTQVDRPVVAADLSATLSRVLPDDATVTIVSRLGSPDERVAVVRVDDLVTERFDERTSIVIPWADVGWHGLVTTNRLLRQECPWDRKQTHHSLIRHLIEETYETVDALNALGAEAPGGDPDYVAYGAVEEELGDLLLQVVFHATLAREVGAFDVEEIAESIRRKLVARHPHVFGDTVANDSATVEANWERLKADEKDRESLMDDIPISLPALSRAAKVQGRAASVGFDWPEVAPVFAKVREELEELHREISSGSRDRLVDELGDVLFSVVNLARHLDIDAESALRRASDRFAGRFRAIEADGPLQGLSLDELDALWERAKAGEADTIR